MKLERIAGLRERRMLDARKGTRATLWIMAIMIFLTVLAAALGLAMARAGRALDRQLAARLTVQVVEPDPARLAVQVAALKQTLGKKANVARVREVDRAELAALLKPWLGDAGLDPDLPMPALLDVDLRDSSEVTIVDVETAAHAVVPGARIDRNARWLAPARSFMGVLGWLGAALVALMASACAAVVLLAARSGLDTHRDTIEVLHMLGSTDVQVARLFQHRIALDTLAGGVIGALAAGALVLPLQTQAGDIGSEPAQGAVLAPLDWLLLALLPLLFTLLATFAARASVLRALGKSL